MKSISAVCLRKAAGTALTIDGNGVVLEDQLNEASKTKSDYNRMLTIYGKYKTMLQTANTKINI